jgi:hypothetical protein
MMGVIDPLKPPLRRPVARAKASSAMTNLLYPRRALAFLLQAGPRRVGQTKPRH